MNCFELWISSSVLMLRVPVSTMQELLSFSTLSLIKSMAVSGHTVCVAFQTSLSVSVYYPEGAKLRHISSVDCKNAVMAALSGELVGHVRDQESSLQRLVCVRLHEQCSNVNVSSPAPPFRL